jgi:hypothetical protein
VLSLPTPLARLYGLAMHMDFVVRDGADNWNDLENDTAAICIFGKYIALNPALQDDQLRAEVLAMALAVVPGMTNVPECDEVGSIYPRHGYVCSTLNRLPDSEATSIGKLATLFARQCGVDTESAAFEWYLPEFTDDAEEGE